MTLTFMHLPKYLFTSESVTEGHPDKMCDQISDAVLDELIRQDSHSRVACECATKTGFVIAMGEITTKGFADFDKLVREVVIGVGYDRAKKGFDGSTCGVMVALANQSPDIARGVNQAKEAKEGEMDDEDTVEALGAGDQGMMFGYATTETPSLMPAPIYYAHNLSRRLAEVRKTGALNFLRPDGKTQVSVEYRQGKPVRIDNVVVSSQHTSEVSYEEIVEGIKREVIYKVMPADMMDASTRILINTTGRFVAGGPLADCGLTGRKIINDTYGGMGNHGGGAFSGKDPSKVDRSGAYMARYVAKNVVAAGLAGTCEVQIAYAIGVAEPVSVLVTTGGTGVVPDEVLTKAVKDVFDLRPYFIIKRLNLIQPIYQKTACYGHFGREDVLFPWEVTDATSDLKTAAKA